jgi:hypothetical protein
LNGFVLYAFGRQDVHGFADEVRGRPVCFLADRDRVAGMPVPAIEVKDSSVRPGTGVDTLLASPYDRKTSPRPADGLLTIAFPARGF